MYQPIDSVHTLECIWVEMVAHTVSSFHSCVFSSLTNQTSYFFSYLPLTWRKILLQMYLHESLTQSRKPSSSFLHFHVRHMKIHSKLLSMTSRKYHKKILQSYANKIWLSRENFENVCFSVGSTSSDWESRAWRNQAVFFSFFFYFQAISNDLFFSVFRYSASIYIC